MIWQDLVFAIGSGLFSLALLPSIFSKDKPAIVSSLTTGAVLAIFTLAYWTLDLRWSAISSLVTTSLWLLLAFQKSREAKK